MNQITAEKIARYQLAFRESLKATTDKGWSWPKRKAMANKDAAQVSPSVAEAMSMIMIWRRKIKAAKPNAAAPMSSGEYYLINRALAWKTKQKKKYDTPKAIAVPANMSKATGISGAVGSTGIKFKKGYICDWYEQWFMENDTIHAQDKELAFALGCSQGAFTNARTKMREKGFEIDKTNGSWSVTARPVDERKKAQIDEVKDYLDVLARELAETQEKLASLGA
jgi:hypothetical protein